MKTSIDLPDDLYRRLKAKSALQGRPVRDVAIELFARWVGASGTSTPVSDAAPEVAIPAEGRNAASESTWLARWEALGDQLQRASTGYVAQLNDDRR